MISVFDVVLLTIFAWAGYRLWWGTTSNAARGVSIVSLLLLAWTVVGL
jgi:hypothetical protein